jgi:hypothetical protein
LLSDLFYVMFVLWVEIAIESDFLHLLRADCGLKMNHYQMVRYDTSHVLAHDPTHRQALLLLSSAMYRVLVSISSFY